MYRSRIVRYGLPVIALGMMPFIVGCSGGTEGDPDAKTVAAILEKNEAAAKAFPPVKGNRTNPNIPVGMQSNVPPGTKIPGGR